MSLCGWHCFYKGYVVYFPSLAPLVSCHLSADCCLIKGIIYLYLNHWPHSLIHYPLHCVVSNKVRFQTQIIILGSIVTATQCHIIIFIHQSKVEWCIICIMCNF